MWASASFTVHGSRVGGRGTRRFQSPGRSRATRRSSAANSRRVRSTTFLRMCRMAAGSLVERQHRAGNLPRLHRPERLVDVVEPPPAADHLVEQESPLAVELEVERDVAAEAVGAHPGRLPPTLRADGHPGEFDLRVRREDRSEEHTSELQSLAYLVCRLLLEKKKNIKAQNTITRTQNNDDKRIS